ncbi:hypothetical protein RAD16_26165 [Bradyrhizobium sp. 18BD]
MNDSLFARARLAIEESAALREQRRSLQEMFDRQREELRRSVLESAMSRSESSAYRQNRED